MVNLKRLNEVINSINEQYTKHGIFGLICGVDIVSGGIIRLQAAEAVWNRKDGRESLCWR